MSATLDPRRREAARLAELDRLEAMRPEADRVLQELVDDAREVFGTEFCLVNLVTSDTQYFRAWSGALPSELAEVKRNPGGPSMCRYVVEDERPFVVEDFSTTEQAKVRRLRMGPGVRFYAGTPLKTSGGHAIGSFCVLDGRPREFGEKDTATLRAFAKAVVGRLEALGAAAHEREAKESERRYRRNVFELANDAILIYGAETGLILDANRRACEMYGIPQETLVGKKIFELSSEPKEEYSQELVFAADGELDSINCGLGEGDVAFVDQADLDAEGTNMQDFIRLTSCEKINEPVIEEPPVETPALGPETGRRGRAGFYGNRPSLFTLSWRLGSWWGSSSTRAAGAGTR